MFIDRVDAGRQLGEKLRGYAGKDVVVVGLPRGGVPVAYEVAAVLGAPLDVIVVRKLGIPFQPELAMGAVGEGGCDIVSDWLVHEARVSDQELAAVEQRERDEVERRARHFRRGRPPLPLAGRTVIVVDDGIATGSTAHAACQVARAQGARRVILAAPVGPDDVADRLGPDADEVVCLHTPPLFFAVGQAYVDFAPTTDEEVIDLLDRAATRRGHADGDTVYADPPQHDEDLTLPFGGVQLAGHLTVPENAAGIVVFAHGSGSSRHSPRNRHVAAALNAAGLGTLLFDLLTVDEERDRSNVFDIELLARRLLDVTTWLQTLPDIPHRIGYFGASTGAAAALSAAADPAANIAAVVSRGGRPDLAGQKLALVRAPTLLIVGGYDDVVLELNRAAQTRMRCRTASRSCPRPPTCSKNPARSTPSPASPATGSLPTSHRRRAALRPPPALDLRATNGPFE